MFVCVRNKETALFFVVVLVFVVLCFAFFVFCQQQHFAAATTLLFVIFLYCTSLECTLKGCMRAQVVGGHRVPGGVDNRGVCGWQEERGVVEAAVV